MVEQMTSDQFALKLQEAKNLALELDLEVKEGGYMALWIGGDVNPSKPGRNYPEVVKVFFDDSEDIWAAEHHMPGMFGLSWDDAGLAAETFNVALLGALDNWFDKGPELLRLGLKKY